MESTVVYPVFFSGSPRDGFKEWMLSTLKYFTDNKLQ